MISSYQMMMIFLVPMFIMSSSYYRVIAVLWRSTQNMKVLTNARSEEVEPTFLVTPYTVRTDERPSLGGGKLK